LARLTGGFESCSSCHLINPVSTSPAGLAVTWTNAPQTSPGSYPVTATINNPNHQGTATGTFVIAKVSATVMDGALAGQRFEIDAAISSGNKITLDSATTLAELAGSRIAVRTHWVPADLLPPAAFTTADRLLLFNTDANTFTTVIHENAA
jgi:hypothetical protein